jgi:3-oxoadipate enol-lactonase
MRLRFVRCDSSVHWAVSELPAAESAGSDRAAALLLVHALGTSHRIWDGVVEALRWPGPVLRYDLRGHGLSEVGEQPYTIASLARDAGLLLDAWGVSSVVVCGLSVGGLIAQELALSDRRVRAAVLCATAARIGTAAGWQTRIEQVRAGGVSSLSEVVLGRWFSPAFRAEQPELVRGYRCLLERTPEAGYLAMLGALAEADLSERVRQITVPTLVISGELDEATTPGDGERLASSIPGARFVLLRGASHLLSVEQPLQVASAIAGFAKGLGLG